MIGFLVGLLAVATFLSVLYMIGWVVEQIGPDWVEAMEYRIVAGFVTLLLLAALFLICGMLYGLGTHILQTFK